MRWILDLLRTVFTWVVGVVATMVAAPLVLIIAVFTSTSPMIDRIIRIWARMWLLASGTRLTVVGEENIDRDHSYVVVANHLSTLDIMTCLLAVPVPIRFLAKKELFQIPLFAQAMRAIGIIEVDRSARSAVHARVNEQAEQLIAAKRSLIIFPEGTRPRDGAMRPFKKGAFTMAISARLPIIPVTIQGSFEAFPPGREWIHGGHITACIDPPLETTDMTHADTGALRDRAYEIISTRVADLGGRISK
jgi:1-acyl-sn-glycerol-3-phosphate acyltransferase